MGRAKLHSRRRHCLMPCPISENAAQVLSQRIRITNPHRCTGSNGIFGGPGKIVGMRP